MSRRRKILFSATALVVAVVALAWALFGRGGKMEVQLSFVGHTNYTFTFTNRTGEPYVGTGNVFRALVLASNSGSVPMEVSAVGRSENLVQTATGTAWRGGYAAATWVNGPEMLKPGETALVEVVPQNPGVAWFTEVRAYRRGTGDRLYDRAQAIPNETVRLILRELLPSPKFEWFTLGPVTNPLPALLRPDNDAAYRPKSSLPRSIPLPRERP